MDRLENETNRALTRPPSPEQGQDTRHHTASSPRLRGEVRQDSASSRAILPTPHSRSPPRSPSARLSAVLSGPLAACTPWGDSTGSYVLLSQQPLRDGSSLCTCLCFHVYVNHTSSCPRHPHRGPGCQSSGRFPRERGGTHPSLCSHEGRRHDAKCPLGLDQGRPPAAHVRTRRGHTGTLPATTELVMEVKAVSPSLVSKI